MHLLTTAPIKHLNTNKQLKMMKTAEDAENIPVYTINLLYLRERYNVDCISS